MTLQCDREGSSSMTSHRHRPARISRDHQVQTMLSSYCRVYPSTMTQCFDEQQLRRVTPRELALTYRCIPKKTSRCCHRLRLRMTSVRVCNWAVGMTSAGSDRSLDLGSPRFRQTQHWSLQWSSDSLACLGENSKSRLERMIKKVKKLIQSNSFSTKVLANDQRHFSIKKTLCQMPYLPTNISPLFSQTLTSQL